MPAWHRTAKNFSEKGLLTMPITFLLVLQAVVTLAVQHCSSRWTLKVVQKSRAL